MKALKDSIYEKLKVDDISIEDFPINGTIDDICNFLKNEGFIEGNDLKIMVWSAYFPSMNSYKTKIFYKTLAEVPSIAHSIKFANTTKHSISKDNPLFNIILDSKSNDRIFQLWADRNINETVSEKEFLKELNKHFGW